MEERELACTEKDFRVCAEMAVSFYRRFTGLMGRKGLYENRGLFLENCGSVHMFFMRFPIRAIYLDKDFTVIYHEELKPWQLGKFVKGARHVLEVNTFCGRELSPGDVIRISAGKRRGSGLKS